MIACERQKAPAILQMFPITLERNGPEFLQYCIDVYVPTLPLSHSPETRISAHNASVPIAVHLDHATDAEHLELAIGLAETKGIKFDSIMVDASHADVRPSSHLFSKPEIVSDEGVDGRGEHRHCGTLHQKMCSPRHLDGGRAGPTRRWGGWRQGDLG